jgi:hypothetical protein
LSTTSASDRVERALAYLDEVVAGTTSPDATRVAAARAIIARDGREAAQGTSDGVPQGYRVIVPYDEAGDDDA